MTRHRRSFPLPALALAVWAIVMAPACSDSDSPVEPGQGALFQIRACRGSLHAPAGEVFRVLVLDADQIRLGGTLIGRGNVRIVGGSLAAGDGGFNAPWSWHLDPGSVVFSEGAVEVCDGCPSFVEGDLDYWLRVGSYCPWSAEVEARLQ
jgi:hypothetical protein